MLARGCPRAGPCPTLEAACTSGVMASSSHVHLASPAFSTHRCRLMSRGPARAVTQQQQPVVAALSSLSRSSKLTRQQRRSFRFKAAEVSAEASAAQEDAAAAEGAAAAAAAKAVPKSDTWELDFCSRPIIDERGKKLWELIICDPSRDFEFAQYFPNNKINSTQLKNTLQQLLAQDGAVKPEKCRFFRGQMQTIITTALMELEIQPLPSRRCFSLTGWLQERVDGVYRNHPGYSEKAGTLFTLDLDVPQELPDALRGESWCFVQLPLGDLLKELDTVFATGEAFGATFDLATIGEGTMPMDTLIPGLCVFSRRALPLAAWTNGLELAGVKADTDRACLILETGVNQRWRYGSYRRSPEATAEAAAWEEIKTSVGGLHFLVIQEGEESDIAGMWLMADREPPSI